MNRIGIAATAAACCLWLACSSPATPERSYYLLRAESAAALPPADPERRAGIAAIDLAPYLDRAGLVVGLGPHEVREARFHLWAEPLRSGILARLEDRISQRLGYRIGGGQAAARTWTRRVSVEIRELHGQPSGTVRLSAGFTVTDAAGNVLSIEQVVASTEQSAPGYGALVEAELVLLDQLADAIAERLR